MLVTCWGCRPCRPRKSSCWTSSRTSCWFCARPSWPTSSRRPCWPSWLLSWQLSSSPRVSPPAERRPLAFLPAPADGRSAPSGASPRSGTLSRFPVRRKRKPPPHARHVVVSDIHLSSRTDESCIAKMLTHPHKMATSFHAPREVLPAKSATNAPRSLVRSARISSRTKNSVRDIALSPRRPLVATLRSFPQRGAHARRCGRCDARRARHFARHSVRSSAIRRACRANFRSARASSSVGS